MAVIWTSKQPWLRRPSRIVQIDWASPLARGLVCYIDWGNLTWPNNRDATTGRTLTVGGTGSGRVRTTRLGESCAFQDYGAGHTFTDSGAHYTPQGGLTYAMRVASSWGDHSFIGRKFINNVIPLELGMVSGYGVRVWNGGFTQTGITNTAAKTDSKWHTWVGVHRGTRLELWLDGALDASNDSAPSPIADAASDLIINTDYSGSSQMFYGYQEWAGVWSRALSPAEIWSLYDPRTRWSLYAPLVRRTYVDVGGGAGSQTLTGDAAVSTWAVAGALSVGAVALVGSTPTAAWTVPSGTLAAGAVALSGAPAAAAWTVPAQALAPGAVALSGTPAASAWTVEAQPLAAGSAALSGAAAVSAWTVPTGALSAGDAPQALAGDPAVASWTVPVGAVTAGSVALSGAAAASAWAVPAQVLTPGAVALTGTPAVATWTVPSGDVTQAGATLTGDPAVSTWGISGVWSIAPVTLVGSPASSTWTLPTGTWPFSVLARRLRVLLASRSRARLGASRTRARIRASQD